MKTMTKLFLMIALLGSTAMADGDQGNGGFAGCTVDCPPPPCITDCSASEDSMSQSSKVILDFIEEFLGLSF